MNYTSTFTFYYEGDFCTTMGWKRLRIKMTDNPYKGLLRILG
ncbi:hypothetical protein PROVRUST_04759 [Providencia rustigianii DSM 4541]|uniref:Uncharacterized protein n=1 Tax=Providencia rustigianii DSM 4541 TaxID=500637 RepID=D1NXX0_9GAMM|nr:hypothetical protein PROVRUST_04759 [Providencia rustigianii DSM 4541]